jgi:enoyl-CoA hydratase/carnithine racemase
VPSAKVGLPEVLIGILPGGGGTQRLPRLIGPKAAMEMIVSGRHVAAAEAKKLGIVGCAVHSPSESLVQNSAARPQRGRRDSGRTSRSAVDNPPRNTAG